MHDALGTQGATADAETQLAGVPLSEKNVLADNNKFISERGKGVSLARRLMNHYPHYLRVVRSLPYAALRRIKRKPCRNYDVMRPFFIDKQGLEIGGPSKSFGKGRLIPVYDCCGRLDNCNFSGQTIWDTQGDHRAFGSLVKTQSVSEATDLSAIADETYDFLLASHVLEHTSNPLLALQEWKRVIVPQGVLVIIVPDKRTTFDHRRPFTSIEHIESDFRANTSESDLTHLNEILELHDLGLDPGAGTPQEFRDRCLRNASVRAMHHHVFSPEVLILMFTRLRMRVLNVAIERPYHILVCAQKVDEAAEHAIQEKNSELLREDADWRLYDPFG